MGLGWHRIRERLAAERLLSRHLDDRLFRKVNSLIWRFSPIVEGFKSIKAYHAGDGVWVEVDILLDPYTPLMKSHDIAETLQYCLEGLLEADRAFVTTDYTYSGPMGTVLRSTSITE